MCHKKYPAFVSKGFRNWKKTGKRFFEHCHKDSKELLDMTDNEAGVGEQMNGSLANQNAKNW